jgi:hypothetical protein
VECDRGEADDGCEACQRHEDQVQRELVVVEVLEAGLERDGEQEAADELGARECDPQLLEDVGLVAVAAFVRCLVASVAASRVARRWVVLWR